MPEHVLVHQEGTRRDLAPPDEQGQLRTPDLRGRPEHPRIIGPVERDGRVEVVPVHRLRHQLQVVHQTDELAPREADIRQRLVVQVVLQQSRDPQERQAQFLDLETSGVSDRQEALRWGGRLVARARPC